MTVNKITTPPSQKVVIDKINEVIDNLGGGGAAPVWGNITGTLSNQTDLQNVLDNKINKQDPVTPLGYNSKSSVTVNNMTGVIRMNPIGFLSGYSAYYPDVLSNSVLVPTTKKGNRILDTTQVLMYEGSLDGGILDEVTITFPSQFTNNTVGAKVIIGNLNAGIFTPHIWVDDTTLYTGDNFSIYNTVNCGVPETVYIGGNAFSPETITSTNTTNSIKIVNHGGYAEVVAKLQVEEGLTANKNLFDILTSFPIEDLNCVIFGLLTGNGLYFAQDFSIATLSETLWAPTSTALREYLTLSLGSGTGVSNTGQLQVVGVTDSSDNSTTIKTWTGTKTQYDTIVTKDANTLYWLTDVKIIYLGDVAIGNFKGGRNIGEIISSTLPLTDAGLHLLDGSLILGGGIYDEFVDYIADLYTQDPTASYFTTEALWQTSVTTYGVCGKFVYDSVNNTVRLPKITGIIEGTTDISALGDLIEAGLPNITGNFGSAGNQPTASGCFDVTVNNLGNHNGNNNVSYGNFSFNASHSSSIYGNSSTVQPQTIKCFVYIVIANSSKTEIQVDIDEVATDLNGKADVDLSNISASQTAKNEITSWGIPDYSAGISIGSAVGTTYTAPSNGWVLARRGQGGYRANSEFGVKVNDIAVFYSAGYDQYSTSFVVTSLIPVEKDDVIYIYANNTNDSSASFFPTKGAN